ncbi:MAG: MarR family winged helix-turn-helix transcriptional regulator [Actinomycetota bacterium]|nr:MarR family transcriptional regulator [Actinomycetota bacterium]
MPLSERDYRRLLEVRTGLRRFIRWSEEEAAAHGISAAHHQLMLAVRGHPGDADPSIRDIAESLLLRHHSAVELIDRAAVAGLIKRVSDKDDRRITRITLTARGNRLLEQLTSRHMEELARFVPELSKLIAV